MNRSLTNDRGSKLKRKKAALKEFRRAVLARAKVPGGWKCERCSKVFPYEISTHHRLPRSQGGSNCITNGHALCWNCHDLVHRHFGDWADWIVVRNELGKTA